MSLRGEERTEVSEGVARRASTSEGGWRRAISPGALREDTSRRHDFHNQLTAQYTRSRSREAPPHFYPMLTINIEIYSTPTFFHPLRIQMVCFFFVLHSAAVLMRAANKCARERRRQRDANAVELIRSGACVLRKRGARLKPRL